MAKNYAALLRKMLSPRREPFDGAALGPSGFEFRGRRVRRDDFQVQNDRGLELACSLWRDEGHGAPGAPPSPGGFRPLSRFRSAKKDRRFCVLYVHDVGGSRLGALSCLGVALDAGAAGYCAFDTTACGRSGGAHVSFGHFERWDVGAVAQELVKRRGFTDVVLWGRGAGAVAALLYARFAQAPPAKRRSSKESWEWSDYYGGSGGPAGAGPGACECDEHGYPKRRPRAVDVFSQGSTTRGGISTCPDYEGDEAARSKAARGFLRGLEVSTMTVMWVVSKPPLYVSAVAKGSAAADCGLEVGDVIAGIGSSMRLPHTADEFAEILLKLAERPRPDLVVHVYRDATAGELAAPPCPYPQVVPAGLVLDCAVDSPSAVVDALKAHALEREPVLVTLLEPVLSSALDILYHSIQKRANFDPTAIKGTDVAAAVRNVPALFAVNDFSDLDRGIPKLAALTSTVYDAYKGGAKSLVRYNSPLRLALRGTRVARGPRPSFLSPTRVPPVGSTPCRPSSSTRPSSSSRASTASSPCRRRPRAPAARPCPAGSSRRGPGPRPRRSRPSTTTRAPRSSSTRAARAPERTPPRGRGGRARGAGVYALLFRNSERDGLVARGCHEPTHVGVLLVVRIG